MYKMEATDLQEETIVHLLISKEESKLHLTQETTPEHLNKNTEYNKDLIVIKKKKVMNKELETTKVDNQKAMGLTLLMM